MSKYTGKTVSVNCSPAEICDKFADLTVLNSHLDKIPEDQKAKIGNLRCLPDAIIITNPAIGEMTFKITERNPDCIVFKADGLLPLKIDVLLKGTDNDTKTDVTAVLDIEIPAMLRPMIGGKLQQVADMFSQMIARLCAN